MLLNLIRLVFLLTSFTLFASKLPELTPRDTKVKIQEILKAHVNYHALTSELIARAFTNYLSEIDPGKTYLIASEISPWTDPSETLLQETLINVNKGNFSNFDDFWSFFERFLRFWGKSGVKIGKGGVVFALFSHF